MVGDVRERDGRLPGLRGALFTLACSFDEPATDAEISSVWPDAGVPNELAQVWKNSRHSRLFEEVDYGQWGPAAVVRGTPATRSAGACSAFWGLLGRRHRDRESLGDQELVVVALSEADRRRALIALPMEDRSAGTLLVAIRRVLGLLLVRHSAKKWVAALCGITSGNLSGRTSFVVCVRTTEEDTSATRFPAGAGMVDLLARGPRSVPADTALRAYGPEVGGGVSCRGSGGSDGAAGLP